MSDNKNDGFTDDICKRLAKIKVKTELDATCEEITTGQIVTDLVERTARALADAGVREAVGQLEILADEERVHMPPQIRSDRAAQALAALSGQENE